MSVGCLLGLPEAQGLFHRAIPMSGAAHATNSPEGSKRVAAMLCRELSVADGDVAALRALPVDTILKAQATLELRLQGSAERVGFRPNVGDTSLPAPPCDAIRDGLSRDIPVLVGTTLDEWRLLGMADGGAAKLDRHDLEARIEERAPGHGERITQAYADARPGASPSDLFFAIETDRIFRIPAIRLGEAQSAHQAATWAYLYTWESPAMGGGLGACHGVDVPFAFGLIGTKGADFFAGGGPAAERLAEQTMDAWLGFARGGDPGHSGLPTWMSFESAARQTMLLGSGCELVSDPYSAERTAWDGVID
jgi:para-nitrobenzyl esterase